MIGEAVASVLAQTVRGFSLVVVDDGSTDATAAAARAAVAGATIPCAVVTQPGRGVAAARNAGVRATTEPWIAFLDSDDLWMPAKLERQLAWAATHPTMRLNQTEERWLDGGRHRNPRAWHRKEERVFRRSVARCLVSPSAVMIARDLYDRTGGFDETFPVCEDYEYWLRITAHEPVGLVPETLVVKRGGHRDQLSRSTWGLDRWRVAALVKLFATTALDDDDHALVRATVVEKCAILAAGAERRGRVDEADRYRRLAETVRTFEPRGDGERRPTATETRGVEVSSWSSGPTPDSATSMR